ncbi:coenzyme F390 synthetase [Clostridiales bacterium PH28_bin88]|nr:coenzyme F390 synthetase [Clostridiales bacterium PH28_bin88]
MGSYRKYWDAEIETMPREELKKYQLKLLREAVDYSYNRSPYYRRAFDMHNVKPEDLKSLEDLKRFPTMNKITLRERQQAVPDFGDITCVPEEEIVYMSASSGSTGVPTASPFTYQDFEDFQDFEARLFWSSGMRPSDRYVHALNFTLFVGGPDVIGAQKVGALCIWAGTVPSERMISILQTWRPTITWTTPSYAWYLGETAKAQGIDPAKDLAIKKIFVAGEPGGSIPETREAIEALWGADLYDYYGLSDIFGACAGMCEEKDGLHWAEDHIFTEVIDPETGEEVEEGARGELVLTSIKKKARPLIRFRTADIVSYTTEKCRCGRTHMRLHGIHGRLDDMLIIKGVNVFPSDIEAIVRKNPDLTGEYRIIVTEEMHLASITVEVEHAPHVHGDVSRLGAEVEKECLKIVGIKPRVKVLAPNTLPRATHKAKRVFDERKPG